VYCVVLNREANQEKVNSSYSSSKIGSQALYSDANYLHRMMFFKFGVVTGIAVRKIGRWKHRLEDIPLGRHGIEAIQAGFSYLS
jgi:hypothetical protein